MEVAAASDSGSVPTKGLKMKIKCQAGGAGMPVRHEVSHFLPIGAAAQPPTTTSSSAGAVDGSGCRATESAKLADRDSVVAPSHAARTSASSAGGSHRKDHRGQTAKDRAAAAGSASNKDRSTAAADHAHPGGASNASICEDVKPSIDRLDRDSVEPQPDPYEFNVKTEDAAVSRPTKKIKLEKVGIPVRLICL